MSRYFYSKREVVENCLKLDIFNLNKSVSLRSKHLEGDIKIGEKNSMGFIYDGENLIFNLEYAVIRGDKREDKKEIIYLTFTETNLGKGGIRFWFICPYCQKRVATLYKPIKDLSLPFKCRDCYNLTYKVQKEHNKKIDMAIKKFKRGETPNIKELGLLNAVKLLNKIIRENK